MSIKLMLEYCKFRYLLAKGLKIRSEGMLIGVSTIVHK